MYVSMCVSVGVNMSHVTNTDEISLQQYSKRKAQRDVQDYRATKHNEFYKCRFNNTASTNHKEMCKTIERLVEVGLII